LPAAPVVVKVQTADRYAGNTFSLNIRRFLGASLSDAKGLVRRVKENSFHRLGFPDSDYECQLGDGESIVDARYFKLDVTETTSGTAQKIRLDCVCSNSGGPLRLIIGQQLARDVLSVPANSQFGLGAISVTVELIAGHYFVVAQRQSGNRLCAIGFSTHLGFQCFNTLYPRCLRNHYKTRRVQPFSRASTTRGN
jgi:hypothetical protein